MQSIKPICIADTRNQVDDFAVDLIEKCGYSVMRTKLPFGDFAFADNLNCAVDIKSSSGGIIELAKNVCSSDHTRLVNEIMECAKWHGELCFLIANEDGITKLDQLADWKSPVFKWDTYSTLYDYNGEWVKKEKLIMLLKGDECISDFDTKRVRTHFKGEPITRVKGETLMKALKTMSQPNKYADGLTIRFVFCDKKDAGTKILEILNWYKQKKSV